MPDSTNPIPSTASDYFGHMADSYDSLIRRAVPNYDEMTERLVECLPAPDSSSNPRILELGCGTGNLTLNLFSRYPTAHITAVDAAPEMTTLTAARVSKIGAADRVTAITGRFEDLIFPPKSFDLITSCMSLHHVINKQSLYHNIRNWLTSRGTLRFADMIRGETSATQQLHWNLWLDFCRQPGHCTPEELKDLEAHAAAHDHYVPLSDHFKMLAAANFINQDCLWRNGMYTVITADAKA